MKRILALVLVLVMALAVFYGCKNEKIDEFPIKWEYVTGLPADFPVLCEKLTTTYENYGKESTEIELAWSRVGKEDFDGYKAKIEEWAGAKFGAQDENNIAVLTATVGNKEIKVQAIYNPDATGNHIQGAVYDCQGRIIVTH